MKQSTVNVQGCAQFRNRLLCATLAGRTLRINNIRADDAEPGVREYEVSFLRLLETITNGSVIEISPTGTRVRYVPGLPVGGRFKFDCHVDRGIGWYLEGILPLLPFGMSAFNITLSGVTNNGEDQCVDLIRTVTLPLLSRFGVEEGLEFKVLARGAPPLGGGAVNVKFQVKRKLQSLMLTEESKIKRVRGIAYGTRVSPAMTTRLVDGAKALLSRFTGDCYIYTDHYKGKESGNSPGFGLALVAETLSGCMLSAEACASAEGGDVPEAVGEKAAKLLLAEVMRGGCVDSNNQSLALLFMALGPKEVSKIRTGPLTPFTIGALRVMRDLLDVMFKIESTKNGSVLLTCVGRGNVNIAKLSR